jgi:hypothetical protein
MYTYTSCLFGEEIVHIILHMCLFFFLSWGFLPNDVYVSSQGCELLLTRKGVQGTGGLHVEKDRGQSKGRQKIGLSINFILNESARA